MPAWLTSSLIIDHLRFRIRNEINLRKGLRTMAIEIKGLRGKSVKAGAMFDRLNTAYDKLIETGDAHASDVEGLAPQIVSMQDDITFAVQTLGNSVGGSGEKVDPPKTTIDGSPVVVPPVVTFQDK